MTAYRSAYGVAAVVLLATGAAPAGAVLMPATVLDGPSADVLELGGVALAPDGTGGIVYRRRVDGRSHVFAAGFAHGRWSRPQRVDAGQRFDSTWPRIAAGARGRLIVVWAQEFGPGSDRLYAASLDPGATRFERPSAIDLDIGEASSTFPSVAMSPGGSAYVTYRVITRTASELRASGAPEGYVGAETRLARFNGLTWSSLGSVTRSPDALVRQPDVGNSPKVALDRAGNGIVAFHEPDDQLVDRVWARRVFGGTVGNPLLVSPQRVGDRPLRGPADAFDVDVSGFAAGAVAFRQQPGDGAALASPRMFVNTIPEGFTDTAADFRGAELVDGAAAEAVPAPGPPSVSLGERGDWRLAFAAGEPRLVDGDDQGRPTATTRLDGGGASPAGDPLVAAGAGGAAVSAWPVATAERSGIAIEERRAGGARSAGTVSSRAGGRVTGVEVAGSGLGDAIVAFRQGGESSGQIVTAIVDAPPGGFGLALPSEPVRPTQARIAWEPSPNALGRVTYTVFVDGHARARDLTRRSLRIDRRGLGDGAYEVAVVAADERGQRTRSVADRLVIDGSPPRASVRRRGGRAVEVRISDGRRGQASGVQRSRVSIRFGDGARVRGRARARHVYRRPGRYRLVIAVRDRAGNRATHVATVRIG